MILMRQYFPIVKERVRAREFNLLFLFVTSRCNSLCRTCFYFDKLNSPDDLTTAQIERISATAPPFRKQPWQPMASALPAGSPESALAPVSGSDSELANSGNATLAESASPSSTRTTSVGTRGIT